MAPADPPVSGFAAYVDPKRKVGSQKETPRITIENGRVSVSGYQQYTLEAGRVVRKGLPPKYLKLHRYLAGVARLLRRNGSFLDIGCSAGLLCLLAKEAGLRSVTGLDHDPEYIGVLSAAAQAGGFDINAVVGGWRDGPGEHDVVAGIAIIHWIFSLTASEGSFDAVFSHLASKTRRYLMIEWVDPDDGAIRKFQHIARNTEVQQESYTLPNFLAAAERHLGPLDAVIDTAATRRVYVFRKEPRIAAVATARSNSSIVYFNDTCIHKVFRPGIARQHPAIIRREREALSLLAGQRGFPMLLSASRNELYMTHVGQPLTLANLPPDADEQGRALVQAMRRKNIRHNDIHPGNLLVSRGRLHLVDFAWAAIGDVPLDYLPDRIGVGRRVRHYGDPFDDQAMMDRSLHLVRNPQAE